MVYMNPMKIQKNQTTHFNVVRNKRKAQQSQNEAQNEAVNHLKIIYHLSTNDLHNLLTILPQLVEGSAQELLMSIGGCYSCGNTFKGSTTIINVVGPRQLSCCPQCDQPAVVALNQLNQILSKDLGILVTLSAYVFTELLEKGARQYYHRSILWLAHASMGRRCVGTARLLRKRTWMSKGA